MGLLAKPVRPDESPAELPTDQEPQRVPPVTPRYAARIVQKKGMTRRHLPTGGNDDQILGEVEPDPGDHQKAEDGDRPVDVEEVLDEMVGGFVHRCSVKLLVPSSTLGRLRTMFRPGPHHDLSPFAPIRRRLRDRWYGLAYLTRVRRGLGILMDGPDRRGLPTRAGRTSSWRWSGARGGRIGYVLFLDRSAVDISPASRFWGVLEIHKVHGQRHGILGG